MIREIFPNATISDRTALALFAWHALIVEQSSSPEAAAAAAYAHADAMLLEVMRHECAPARAGSVAGG